MLVQQLQTVNVRLHHVCRDVTPSLLSQGVAPSANPVGFLLWHMPRSQDWAVNTAMRGVPEVVRSSPWSDMPGVSTPGIGTGFSLDQARDLAQALDLSQVLAYADAVNEAVIRWVRGLRESDLESIPDVAAHDAAWPEYQTPGFLAEIDSGPEHDRVVQSAGGQPVWLFLTSVCVTHLHRHLGELDLTLGVMSARTG